MLYPSAVPYDPSSKEMVILTSRIPEVGPRGIMPPGIQEPILSRCKRFRSPTCGNGIPHASGENIKIQIGTDNLSFLQDGFGISGCKNPRIANIRFISFQIAVEEDFQSILGNQSDPPIRLSFEPNG